MSDFQRLAIYYLPEDPALAAFGASWLGWDVETGTPSPQPDVEGIGGFTSTPRKYGFHGTLKPPFHLAADTDIATLAAGLTRFAHDTAPVQLEGLRLSRIGRFLALVPEGDSTALDQLAFACVRDFDRFRRPPGADELARRRVVGLTPRQEELLTTWGYPYVADEFRFHLTLTGKLAPEARTAAEAALRTLLPHLPRPFRVGSIALAVEREDGMFQMIHRYTLTG